MEHLVIRADANSVIGSGHVMRCLALSQAWQESGGNVIFVMNSSTKPIEKLIEDFNCSVYSYKSDIASEDDLKKTILHANQVGSKWVVLDGYSFYSDFQFKLKQAGFNLLVIDDYAHSNHYYADIILNQNCYVSAELYPTSLYEPYTQLLIGPEYTMLRREFLVFRTNQKKISKTAKKILVTIGGGDFDNITLQVINELKQMDTDKLDVIIVVGAVNPNISSLEKVTSKIKSFTLIQNASNMPELMAWADIAITAGGSTCWELAFMGVPSIIIVTAENQKPVAKYLTTSNVSLSLGLWNIQAKNNIISFLNKLMYNMELRSNMSRLGKLLIDGYGAKRVLSKMDV